MTGGEGDRLAKLEARLNSLENSHEAYRDHVVKPRLDDLEDERDDAREERAEFTATIEVLEEEVAGLRAELESIAGLAEDEDTSPDKRVADLRQAMIRRAKARSDGGEGYIGLWWQEVRNLFADLGHGEVSKPDCYKAMEDAAAVGGFTAGTKHNSDGREVKAVCLDVTDLPAFDGSRIPTTGEKVSGGQNGGSAEVVGNSD